MDKSISRRDFLRGMAGLTAVTAVTAIAGVPAAYAEGEAETVERVTTELPIPEKKYTAFRDKVDKIRKKQQKRLSQ